MGFLKGQPMFVRYIKTNQYDPEWCERHPGFQLSLASYPSTLDARVNCIAIVYHHHTILSILSSFYYHELMWLKLVNHPQNHHKWLVLTNKNGVCFFAHISHFWMTLAGRDTPWSACWVPEASRWVAQEIHDPWTEIKLSKVTTQIKGDLGLLAMISCSTYMIILSCIMVIWYMNLYDYMIFYVLIFLSVSELNMSPTGEKGLSGMLRLQCTLWSWGFLLTWALYSFCSGRDTGCKNEEDRLCIVCPLLQYTAYIFVGFYATKHPQVEAVQKSYAVIAMQPGPSDPSDSDCHASSQAARVAQPPARQTWA